MLLKITIDAKLKQQEWWVHYLRSQWVTIQEGRFPIYTYKMMTPVCLLANRLFYALLSYPADYIQCKGDYWGGAVGTLLTSVNGLLQKVKQTQNIIFSPFWLTTITAHLMTDWQYNSMRVGRSVTHNVQALSGVLGTSLLSWIVDFPVSWAMDVHQYFFKSSTLGVKTRAGTLYNIVFDTHFLCKPKI